MKGTNQIRINSETLIEAVQVYIDSWGQNLKVESVRANGREGGYIVTVSEKEKRASVPYSNPLVKITKEILDV